MDKERHKHVVLSDFTVICRICLGKGKLKLFNQTHVFDLFNNITNNIKIKSEEHLPKNVCENCISKLENISCFIDLSKQNTEILNNIFEKSEAKRIAIKDESDVEAPNEPLEFDDVDENIEVKSEKYNTSNVIVDNPDPTLATSKNILKQTRPSRSHPLQCKICGENFISKAKHQKESPNCKIRQYECSICKKSFFTKFKLNIHMRSHTKETPYECKICLKKFRFAPNLKRHDDIAHKGLKPYKCEVCGKEFARLERKIQHSNIHTGKNPYVCGYCGKSFKHRSTFQNHIVDHKIKSGEKKDLSDNECNICKKVFLSKQILQSHLEIHNGERKFLCSVCGKDFLKKCYLDVHSRIHTGEKPYECKQCEKKFKTASSYKSHVLFHTGERLYKCSFCIKMFKQSGHLKSHLKTHTGEKPFRCRFCDKDFALNCNLKIHTRIHTGETPYHCSVCDKRFSNSSSMKKHKRSHIDLKL